MAEDFWAENDVEFDFDTAESLVGSFRAAAGTIDEQAGSRSSAVSTGSENFRGHFATLFLANAHTASGDADELAFRMREVGTQVTHIIDAAREENRRRKAAREWKQRIDARRANILDSTVDFFTGEEDPPEGCTAAGSAPVFRGEPLHTDTREARGVGGGGKGSGVSSAQPSGLRSFAATYSTLNEAIADMPGRLRGLLDDFRDRCAWAMLEAEGVVDGLRRWRTGNDDDAAWARTVADAFAAAGGEGAVSHLSDHAVGNSLARAGAHGREKLEVPPSQVSGEAPTTGFADDPVNTATGAFTEVETDLAFAGGAAGLAFTRTYTSTDAAVGIFGTGWSSILESRLELDETGATQTLPDGRTRFFARSGTGWDRADGENCWIAEATVAGEAVLDITDNAGSRTRFSASGTWLFSEAGPGTRVSPRRDAAGRVVELRHARGRAIAVRWDGERVAEVSAGPEQRVRFDYDDAGRVIAATGARGTRRYRWNAAGLIDAIWDAAGVRLMENEYDAAGRVTSQLSPFGRLSRFAYVPGRITVVSDADGTRANSWLADARGRLILLTDAHGSEQAMSYDRSGNLVRVRDRAGQITTHSYDDRGRRVLTRTPTGARTRMEYDDTDRVTCVRTDPHTAGAAEAAVTFEYTGADRAPATVTDAEGGRTQLDWKDGLLRGVVDPVGVRTGLDYDDRGDLISVTNALGDTLRLERDDAGRIVELLSPGGARTRFRYAPGGELTAREDPDGAVWRFESGPGGRLEAMISPLGIRTEYGYGDHGKRTVVRDGRGREMIRELDDLGNLTALELPGGTRWGFGFDALSRLTEITDPAGELWQSRYDAVGAVTAQTDPTGARVRTRIDRRGRTLRVDDGENRDTVSFDTLGRVDTVTGTDGETGRVVYDRMGRTIAVHGAEGEVTQWRRDAAGRVVERVSPGGARTRCGYDAAGRLAEVTGPLGEKTRVEYDGDGRVIAAVRPDGEVERCGYDPAGRLAWRALPGRGTARYRYDRDGRLTHVSDAWSGQRRLSYDDVGQVIAVRNGLGGVTRFDYDEGGQLIRITDPVGAVTLREYTATGQLAAITDPLGRVTRLGYDAAGRPIWREGADGHRVAWVREQGRVRAMTVDGAEYIRIDTDAASHTLTLTDHSRAGAEPIAQVLRWNRAGQLVEHVRDGERQSWSYDVEGNRTEFVDASGLATGYRWDAAGRLIAVQHPVFGEVTYDLDVEGAVVGAVAGGRAQSWRYRDGAVAEHEDGDRRTRVEHDDAGRITAIESAEGRVTYSYDEAGQITGALVLGTEDAAQGAGFSGEGEGAMRTWTYDLAGRVIAETVAGAVTRFEYDAAGQLLRRVAPDGVTEFGYDGAGRRVFESGPSGIRRWRWNAAGAPEALSVSDADGERESALWVDGLGEMAGIDGVPVRWDSASAVPGLSSVGDLTVAGLPGGVVGIAGAGPGAGGAAAPGGAGAGPGALGSVRSSGWREARASSREDPWASVAAGPVPGLPAGVGLSADGGLQIDGLDWFGERFYDSDTLGFTSVDPLGAVWGVPWGANPYSFAGNDPVHLVDPTGLSPVTDAQLREYASEGDGFLSDVGNWFGDVVGAIGDWFADNWEYVAAGALAAIAFALMCTGIGGIAGIALMAAAGGLMSAAGSVAIQKATTGHVNWGEVAGEFVKGFVLGGVGGVVASVAVKGGALAMQAAGKVLPGVQKVVQSAGRVVTQAVDRAGTALESALGRTGSVIRTVGSTVVSRESGREMLSNGVANGTESEAIYLMDPQKEKTWTGALSVFVTGFGDGSTSSAGGSVAGRIRNNVGRRVVRTGLGSASSLAWTAAKDGLLGEDLNTRDALWAVATGGALSHVPGGDVLRPSLSRANTYGMAGVGGLLAGLGDLTHRVFFGEY